MKTSYQWAIFCGIVGICFATALYTLPLIAPSTIAVPPAWSTSGPAPRSMGAGFGAAPVNHTDGLQLLAADSVPTESKPTSATEEPQAEAQHVDAPAARAPYEPRVALTHFTGVPHVDSHAAPTASFALPGQSSVPRSGPAPQATQPPGPIGRTSPTQSSCADMPTALRELCLHEDAPPPPGPLAQDDGTPEIDSPQLDPDEIDGDVPDGPPDQHGTPIAQIPEPHTLALLALALCGCACIRRRRISIARTWKDRA